MKKFKFLGPNNEYWTYDLKVGKEYLSINRIEFEGRNAIVDDAEDYIFLFEERIKYFELVD